MLTQALYFVREWLQRFGGEPEVDEHKGRLLRAPHDVAEAHIPVNYLVTVECLEPPAMGGREMC